jgi:pimeloyl-ACP methyl ester carboxylesterase
MADVEGSSLYYETRGAGDAVVLLHGFTLDTRMWNSQFETLSKAYKVIRFDMRGHGKSSGAREADGGPMTFSQSEDVQGLLDALHIDRAHVVGLSMGGYVAYEFALAHPDRVRSLTVIDSAWRYDPANTGDFQTRLLGYLGTVGTNGLEAALRGWMSDALFVPASKNAEVKAELEEIVMVGHLAQGPGAFFSNPGSAMSPSPLPETHLSDLGMPTLVLVGALDDPEFRAHADAVAAAVPGSEKIVIEGSGHMSTMEKPDDVNRALEAFLAKH